jgi:uncharacterized iron-regulated membrane protein
MRVLLCSLPQHLSHACLPPGCAQVVLSLVPAMVLVLSCLYGLVSGLWLRWKRDPNSDPSPTPFYDWAWRDTLTPVLLATHLLMPTAIATIYSFWSYDSLDAEVSRARARSA